MRAAPSSSCWGSFAAGLAGVAVFVALTLPTLPHGAVTGTGQDEWYNMMRALRALYEHGDPSYFIHPALFYELLAMIYGGVRVRLALGGAASSGQFLDYVLTHEAQFLDLARCTALACGALAVQAGAWLAGELAGGGAGLLAALLLASLPLLRTMAVSIRVDTLALAMWLAAAALLVRHGRAPTRRTRWVAAAGIGVAAAANYPGALLLLPFVWLEWQTIAARSTLLPRIGAGCGIAGAVFLALNPYAVIDLPTFLRWFTFQANVALETHPNAAPPAAAHYLDVLRAQGAPAMAACAAGCLAALRLRTAGGALGGFALAYLAAFSAMRSQYDRFALPALALLCVVGAAWLCALATRLDKRAGAAVAAAASAATLWLARPTIPPPAPAVPLETDYRADMFEWITTHLSPTATLLFESDTLPRLQTAYDPAAPDSPFSRAMREAFERLNPRLPHRILKAQFIAAIYNYDPALLDQDDVYFLGSSQTRHALADTPERMTVPAAFYAALDPRATVVHQSSGYHELLTLYAVRPRPD